MKTENKSPEFSSAAGLGISNTQTIRSFISDKDHSLTLQPSVSYHSLRSVWFASDPATRPDLLTLLSGSSFIFPSPKPREKGKTVYISQSLDFVEAFYDRMHKVVAIGSEELKVRLRKLEEVAERKAYDELVKDITPKKGVEEPFSSYKDQLGFGLHVVLAMFTGLLVGYAAFRALFGHSPVMNAAGGILGLVVAMLVETLLFIIRASELDSRSAFSTSHLKKNQ